MALPEDNSDFQVNLPDNLGRFAAEQAAQHGLSDASAYVCALVEAAQRDAVREQVTHLLQQAVDSGESQPLTPETWSRIRGEVERRITARRQHGG